MCCTWRDGEHTNARGKKIMIENGIGNFFSSLCYFVCDGFWNFRPSVKAILEVYYVEWKIFINLFDHPICVFVLGLRFETLYRFLWKKVNVNNEARGERETCTAHYDWHTETIFLLFLYIVPSIVFQYGNVQLLLSRIMQKKKTKKLIFTCVSMRRWRASEEEEVALINSRRGRTE